jgi:hypothetical protein
MLNSEQNDEECDATDDDSSNEAGNIIKPNFNIIFYVYRILPNAPSGGWVFLYRTFFMIVH